MTSIRPQYLLRSALLGVALFLSLVAPVAAQDLLPGFGDARDPDVLATMLDRQPEAFRLIDVRTAGEFAAGHIPGAENIDYRVIGTELSAADRDQPIVVYCRSGNRSGQAARTLRSLGFTAVADFGAVGRWNGPLVEGSR